jgi:hypothetical protein
MHEQLPTASVDIEFFKLISDSRPQSWAPMKR